MYLFIVLFVNYYLLTNCALAASARKSFRKHNAETDNFPEHPTSKISTSTNVTVPKNCKFCVNNDTDCIVFDSDRCEYNIRMGIIAESDRMEDKFEVNSNNFYKSDVDSVFGDMMEKAVADESFKECIPFVSQYSDCYSENFCTGCSVCACAASGQWNCMMTQKCKPQHQVFMDHQVFAVLMENLGADEPDAENEGYYLDPVIIEAEQSAKDTRTNKREIISADPVLNMPLHVTEHKITQTKSNTGNSDSKNNISNKGELPITTTSSPLNYTQDASPQSGDTTANSVDYIYSYTRSKTVADTINNIIADTNDTASTSQYNIAVNNYSDSHISDSKEIAGDTTIAVPLNNIKYYITQSNDTAAYNNDDNHNSNKIKQSTDMKINTYVNVSQDNKKIQPNTLALNGEDESHNSYKREISTDTTVTVPKNYTSVNITQSIDTNVNVATNNNQSATNEDINYNTTTVGNPITSSHSKMIPDENVEDIKEFVLYPISEIVKEKETELNELVTIKDNLLNLLALCKKFFDANNGSRSNLSVQDNSQAFISLYNSKILPELKKEMSDREDADGIRKEDKLKDDLEVLMKDIIYLQKHNFETLPDDMKSVLRGLKYYSLEFIKQHRVKDKPYSKIETHTQYQAKRHKKIHCFVYKALYKIFESLKNTNDTNLTFKSVSSTPKKVLKRIINYNYHMYELPYIKPSIPNENVIMTALLNIESICIKYLNEHKNYNSELYKLKNIHYNFARNIAALSEIISIIDLPRFEDYNLSPLFAHRLEILSDRIVEFLFTLKTQKIAYKDVDNTETTPMNSILVRTSLSKVSVTRRSPKQGVEMIIEERETVMVPLNTNKDVTVRPYLNNTTSQNPINTFIEFLKKAKNEVIKFVQNQLDKIKNQRNKQTQKLKEKEKHFEDVMKKWQKKLGLGHKEKRSLKDVDRKISTAVSNMFTTVFNVFASQSHKLPAVMKSNF